MIHVQVQCFSPFCAAINTVSQIEWLGTEISLFFWWLRSPRSSHWHLMWAAFGVYYYEFNIYSLSTRCNSFHNFRVVYLRLSKHISKPFPAYFTNSLDNWNVLSFILRTLHYSLLYSTPQGLSFIAVLLQANEGGLSFPLPLRPNSLASVFSEKSYA